MINRPKNIISTCTELQTGSLLISTPVNSCNVNTKLLILVTHHSEAGTTGIILNKQLPGKQFLKNICENLDPVTVQYGGPDHLLSESYLVIYPSIKNGWKDSIYWSTDFKDLVTIVHFMSGYNIQYGAYRGCIKWEPDELEQELNNKHWWLTNAYQVNNVLQPGNDTWHSYAKKHGGYFASLIDEDIPVIYN